MIYFNHLIGFGLTLLFWASLWMSSNQSPDPSKMPHPDKFWILNLVGITIIGLSIWLAAR